MKESQPIHPVIGITSRHLATVEGLPTVQVLRVYVTAILNAGGTPILIPPDLLEKNRRSLFDRLDGILFTGGADVGLDHFDGEPHPTISVEPLRDAIELPLLKMAVDENKPFLGICRGVQVMNIALGGTLFTHIIDQYPNALQHDMSNEYPRTFLAHSVRIEKGTRLFEIFGSSELLVNSLHHQGIKVPAPGLRVNAYASDGLVEGIEIPGHKFAIGVQWHPEWMTNHLEMQRLFCKFIELCNSLK